MQAENRTPESNREKTVISKLTQIGRKQLLVNMVCLFEDLKKLCFKKSGIYYVKVHHQTNFVCSLAKRYCVYSSQFATYTEQKFY